tara:strand:+ start:187 stop:393 length:207 start_codon:yes stop_codon:yes gene_type:complete
MYLRLYPTTYEPFPVTRIPGFGRNPAKFVLAEVGNRKSRLSVSVITDGRGWMDKAHENEGVLIPMTNP